MSKCKQIDQLVIDEQFRDQSEAKFTNLNSEINGNGNDKW